MHEIERLVREEVSKYSYKPDTYFVVDEVPTYSYYPNGGHTLRIYMVAKAFDARDPSNLNSIDITVPGRTVPLENTCPEEVPALIWEILTEAIQKWENHERDEWFRCNGQHINHPHPEAKGQYRYERLPTNTGTGTEKELASLRETIAGVLRLPPT